MTWSCSACTYDNKPGDSKCEICRTAAASSNASSSSSTQPTKKHSKSRQATLLGGFLSKAEEEKSTTATKKRSSAKVSSSTEEMHPPPLPNRKKAPASSNTMSMPNKRPAAASTTAVQAHLQVKSSNVKLPELSKESQRIMKEVFGIDKLRNLQPQAVQYALRGQSQLVVMATGGGKSLCYQLPALVRGGTTIVISPLKALIADQVNALVKLGVATAFISSSNTVKQNNQVMERLLQRPLGKQTAAAAAKTTTQSTLTMTGQQQQPHHFPPISLLYCTPEQVQTDRFRDCLMTMKQENRLSGFAVDEAHCISSWGHDFRSAYLKLTWLRQTFPHLPLMACTATATKKVIQDIQEILILKDRPLLVGSFDRKNVFYKVRYKDVLDTMTPRGALGDLVAFIQNQHNKHTSEGKPYSGIVYVHKKTDTSELARAITKETGIRTETYHGGMKDAERQCVQQAWTIGEVQIVIATVAFGMGVDLAHVRFVIHWTIPKNVESFYQESGRAGRDGLPAYSLLYHSRDDQSKLQYLASMQKPTKKENNNNAAAQRALDGLEKIAKYCLEPGCRRQFLLRFFGEKEDETDPKTVCQESCDYCVNPDKVTRAIEAAGCANDFTYHTRPPAKTTNGQWATSPHGDDDVNDGDDNVDFSWYSNGLKITGGEDDGNGETMLGLPENDSKPSAVGFLRASAILERYQAIECQENTSNGFVRFRSMDDTEEDTVAKKRKTAHPTLPEHLTASAPDPLLHFEVAKSASSATSAKDAAAEVARLRAESEQAAKAARDALAAARNKKSAAPPPPPPPSLTFSKKRR